MQTFSEIYDNFPDTAMNLFCSSQNQVTSERLFVHKMRAVCICGTRS